MSKFLFFLRESSNLKVTELVARCSVLSTSSSSFSPRSIITSMLATMMSFTWSISDWTLWGKNIFSCWNQHHDLVLRCYLIRVPHCARIRAFLAESLDFTEEDKNLHLPLSRCHLAITGLNSVFMAKAIAEWTLSPNCLRNLSSTQVRNLKASPRS